MEEDLILSKVLLLTLASVFIVNILVWRESTLDVADISSLPDVVVLAIVS